MLPADAESGHPSVRDAVRERPDDVASVLTGLSTVLVDEEDVERTLQRVVDLAVRAVSGCDAAGVTLLERGRPRTVAHTDPRILPVDSAQYDAGDGPCLAAYRDQRTYRVPMRTADDRWPAFSAAAARAGVRSFLAAPLGTDGEAAGALNLYAWSDDAFDALDEAFVRLLTAQASAAVTNAIRYAGVRALAGQLEAAMASRAVIEQAKGVLMARHQVDDPAAFAMLRRTSQHRNVKLRVVAQEVVDSTRPAAGRLAEGEAG